MIQTISRDRDNPPETIITAPMRCPNCRDIVDGEEGCPYCPLCDDASCTNFAHQMSENRLCASCELDGWMEELKLRSMANPPDPKDMLEADVQVKLWTAWKELAK
jgi:hypothetical protein